MKQETKQNAFNRIRSGDIRPEDYTDERPRVRRAAQVASMMSGELSAEGIEHALSDVTADPSDAVYLSTHRAYLRQLTGGAS